MVFFPPFRVYLGGINLFWWLQQPGRFRRSLALQRGSVHDEKTTFSGVEHKCGSVRDLHSSGFETFNCGHVVCFNLTYIAYMPKKLDLEDELCIGFGNLWAQPVGWFWAVHFRLNLRCFWRLCWATSWCSFFGDLLNNGLNIPSTGVSSCQVGFASAMAKDSSSI